MQAKPCPSWGWMHLLLPVLGVQCPPLPPSISLDMRAAASGLALLACCAQLSAALRLAVLPGPAEIQSTFNLERVASALQMRGHSVCTSRNQRDEDTVPPTTLLLGACHGEVFDAVLAQGQPAIEIADYADRLDVPVVRLLEDGEAVDVLHERPAVLVFASDVSAAAFGDVIEEAPRAILSPESASKSRAEAYAQLEPYMEELVAAKALPPERGSFWDRVVLSKVSCLVSRGVPMVFVAQRILQDVLMHAQYRYMRPGQFNCHRRCMSSSPMLDFETPLGYCQAEACMEYEQPAQSPTTLLLRTNHFDTGCYWLAQPSICM